jgi:hypothetical protein
MEMQKLYTVFVFFIKFSAERVRSQGSVRDRGVFNMLSFVCDLAPGK